MSRRLVLSAGAVLALFTAMGSAAQGSFSPSPLVRLTHATPHLSSGLAARSNEFALDSDSLSDLRSTSYGRSLLVLPIIIGCFGMLMGIVFMLSVIARICFKSCRFEPDRDEVKGVSKKELQEWTRRHITRRETKKVQFIALFLLALAAIHVAYLGNQYLTLGFRNAVGSIDYMVDVFEALEVEGDSLQADGAVMAAGIAAALPNCSQAAAAQSHLADYDAAVAEYNAVVDPVPSELHDISGYSEKYGLVWRTLSMFCIYAAVMLVLVVYGVAYYFAWRSLMALVTVLNLLVIFALLIVCVFEMIIVMGSADFCMDPAKFSVQVVPVGAVQENLAYYLSCEGINPARPYLEEARVYANMLNSSIAALTSSTCPGNSDLIALYSTTAAIDTSISTITGLLTCQPVQVELESLLYTSLCVDTFNGLYIMWISQYSTIFFLFLLCIVGSVIHNFFGAFWYVNDDDVSVLERASKRHEAVERALRTRSSDNYDGSQRSIEDEDEEDDFMRSPERPSSGSQRGLKLRPLELEDVRTEVI